MIDLALIHLISQPEVIFCGWIELLSVLALGGIFGGLIATYKQHCCKAHWWCPLIHHHKVEGTTASVCHWHHTPEAHTKLQARHKRKFGHRLGHGESVIAP